MVSEMLLGAGVLVLTQIVKKYILPKFGATGVHVFVAILSALIVGVQVATTYYPGLLEVLQEVGTYIVGVIGTYEVIVKKIQNS